MPRNRGKEKQVGSSERRPDSPEARSQPVRQAKQAERQTIVNLIEDEEEDTEAPSRPADETESGSFAAEESEFGLLADEESESESLAVEEAESEDEAPAQPPRKRRRASEPGKPRSGHGPPRPEAAAPAPSRSAAYELNEVMRAAPGLEHAASMAVMWAGLQVQQDIALLLAQVLDLLCSRDPGDDTDHTASTSAARNLIAQISRRYTGENDIAAVREPYAELRRLWQATNQDSAASPVQNRRRDGPSEQRRAQ